MFCEPCGEQVECPRHWVRRMRQVAGKVENPGRGRLQAFREHGHGVGAGSPAHLGQLLQLMDSCSSVAMETQVK